MSNRGNKRKVKPRKKQLPKREYEKLRKAAQQMVVEQGIEQKEVASRLNLTEATISGWANNGVEGKWSELRKVRMQCESTESDNLRKLIQALSTQRLNLEAQINDAIHAGESDEEIKLRKRGSSISDEISKYNKVLQTIDKSTYTLGTFIEVMEEIFNTLRVEDEELWEKTIPVQEVITRKKIMELG